MNSCYGCSVTSIDMPTQTFSKKEGWQQEEANLEELIEKYNNTPNRFLFYVWGIFVTAYVRFTIAKSIMELGDDYIYSDTDSVKFINHEKHKKYFEEYNATIDAKIAASSDINEIPEQLYRPKTNKGIEKPIGYFDFEEVYKRFKTLGAKRYMVEKKEAHEIGKGKDKIKTPYSLTISGVNKNVAIPALVEKATKEGKDIFDYFKIGFTFDSSMCGKLLHTYCDYPIKGYMVDYQGKRWKYSELSFIHLEPTSYKLTTTEEYLEELYLDQIERKKKREDIMLK